MSFGGFLQDFQENYLKDKTQPLMQLMQHMGSKTDHSIGLKAALSQNDNSKLHDHLSAIALSKATFPDLVPNQTETVTLDPVMKSEDGQTTALQANPSERNMAFGQGNMPFEKEGLWQSFSDNFDKKRAMLSILNGMSKMAGKRSSGEGIAAFSEGVGEFNDAYNAKKEVNETFQHNFEALKESGLPEQQAQMTAQDPVLTRQYLLQNLQKPKDFSKELTTAGFNPEEVSILGHDPIGARQAILQKISERDRRNHNQEIDPILGNLPVVQLDNNGRPIPKSQEEFLKSLPPTDANLIKSVANYQMPIEKITSLKGPSRERMAKLVSAYDPTFDMSQYNARSAMRKSLTSGTYSQSLNAANLAIQHLATLQDVGKELDNSNWLIWNKIGNTYGSHTGDPRIKKFKLAADAVGSELAKAFKGAGVTSDRQIREWTENLSSDMSPEQLKAAIHTAMDLLGARIDTINQQYSSTMGHPMDFKFFTPKAKQALSKLGINHSAFLGEEDNAVEV